MCTMVVGHDLMECTMSSYPTSELAVAAGQSACCLRHACDIVRLLFRSSKSVEYKCRQNEEPAFVTCSLYAESMCRYIISVCAL